MAGPFADTFVDGDGTNLESHAPTGPNAGSGWTNQSGGAIQINSNSVVDATFVDSNQYRLNNNLGSDEMDVQADFVELIGAGRRGVRCRLDPGDATGWEFGYDANNSRWLVVDGTTSTTAAEAWPGGTVTIKAEMRTGSGKLYVNTGSGFVLKVTHSSNALSGRTYAGIQLLNFDSSGPEHRLDNFSATGITAGGTSMTPSVGSEALTGLTPSPVRGSILTPATP